MECPECGADNPETSRFCGLCYHHFEAARPAAGDPAAGSPSSPSGPATDLWQETATKQPDHDAIAAALLTGKGAGATAGSGVTGDPGVPGVPPQSPGGPGTPPTAIVPLPAAPGGGFDGFGGGGYDGLGNFPTSAPPGGMNAGRWLGFIVAAVFLVVTLLVVFLLVPSLTHTGNKPLSEQSRQRLQDEYNQQAGGYSYQPYTSAYAHTTPTGSGGPPVITAISPSSGMRGTTASVNVTGDNFKKGLSISLRVHNGSTKVSGSSVIVYGDDMIHCQFKLSGCPPGYYDLRVVNGDGSGAEVESVFEVR